MMTVQRVLLTALITLVFSLGLNACGFHLGEQSQVPQDFKQLHIVSEDPYGPFSIKLQQTFRQLGIKLYDAPKQANYTLHIFKDKLSEQEDAVSANNQVRKYTFQYQIKYQIENRNSASLTKINTIRARRHFIANNNQILGTAHEREATLNSMRSDVIRQLLNQLNSPKMQQALHPKAKSTV